MTGVIARLNTTFGFIQPDWERAGDFYFHASTLVDTTFAQLRVGQRVAFDDATGRRGLRAANVRLLGVGRL